ncbi:MAG: RNA-binding protein [Paraglaciecola psychrophila]|jgi:RNA-binding protein
MHLFCADLGQHLTTQAAISIMELSNSKKKHLRTIGHSLNPVVMIAEKGITEAVAKELERALNDHELIKIKININDPAARKAIVAELCLAHRATAIQAIGKVALLLRHAKEPKEKLSNLRRPS